MRLIVAQKSKKNNEIFTLGLQTLNLLDFLKRVYEKVITLS